MIEQRERVVEFLKKNGWSFEYEDKQYWTFNKEGSCEIQVSVNDDKIVLLDDTGDFLHLYINYYTLIGVLMEYRQIACNYKSIDT